MDPALERFVAQFKTLSDALIDSWFIVDADRKIVEFNRAFHALFPRHVARTLHGSACHEVLALEICAERCIAEQCGRERRHVRLDEIGGRPREAEAPMRFVLSGLPIFDDEGRHVGTLEIQRNVTDEATVQSKYQEVLDQEAQERERLAAQIRTRTRVLVETTELLMRTQRELLKLKRGL